MNGADAESLQPRCGSRCRSLDVCLIVSVVVMYLLVAGATVAGFLHIQQKETTNVGVYKMKNVAYLHLSSDHIQNGTMRWLQVLYGEGNTVGSAYTFRDKQHKLTVHQAGSYYVSLVLEVNCRATCSSVTVTLQLGDPREPDKLKCKLALPAGAHKVPAKLECKDVLILDSDSDLLVQMLVGSESKQAELQNWTLEPRHSKFSIFLLDGLAEA